MIFDPSLNIATLVSIGEHPLSGRPRRAQQDARALELGLKLVAKNLQALYVGPAKSPATVSVLKDYLGMGLSQIQVLDVPPRADIINTLHENFKVNCPDIILTGGRTEQGESSGMIPYLLAEQLNIPVVTSITDIVSIDKQTGSAEVLQALPRGQRRKVKVSLPFVASVDMAAPEPRQSTYGWAMRGQLIVTEIKPSIDDVAQGYWQVNSAQIRPKRLKIVRAKTAADRFKAATAKIQGGSGKVIYDSKESAQEIFKLLRDEEML